MKGPKSLNVFWVANLALVVSFAQSISAQTPKRIQFAKGKSSVVVQGVTGTTGVTYVIRAKSGQKLVLSLSPVSKLGIKVETDGNYGHQVLLREEQGGSYEVGLEESGDYTIFVGSTNNRSMSFTLTVKIAKLTDI
jgi:hypothetical protein